MKFCCLASGSSGNCTYVESKKSKILIDAGMTCLYIEKKLNDLGVLPTEIEGIIITHTHIDHISALKVFLKKYHPILYITKEMYDDLKDIIKDNEVVFINEKFIINDIIITPFKISHDAPDANGYILVSDNKSLVYVTDTGYINSKYFDALSNKNAYIFESNHDVKMLMDGKYQYHLKQRILSDKGHLSNKDSSYYLSKIIGNETKYIVLAHLSRENNTKELAYDTLMDILDNQNINVYVAMQNERTDLLQV